MLRKEPFRLFFPLGLVLGATGMIPWLLFGRGMTHVWPGLRHSLTMTQAFLVALAVGFLGTMLPRRLRAEPLGWIELGVLAAALIVVPFGSLLMAELAFLTVLVTLGQYVVRAFRAGAPTMLPSFVLLPVGVLLGASGAFLLIAFDAHLAGPWAFLLGRQLAQQGLMIGLLLALVPMLAPILAHGAPPASKPATRPLYLLAGLAFAGSFPLELWAQRPALLVRGLACAGVFVLAGGLLQTGTRPGVHRWLFRLALWSVPLGLLAAAFEPARRVQLMHVTYVGGLSLVAFAISAHVSMLHGGKAELADRRPLLVILAGALTVAAALVRVGAEGLPEHYLGALTLAATLWLAAAATWATFLGVVRR
jgi:uncharacterized protein involved in response to NO